MTHRVHAFVDGGYLRTVADEAKIPWPNPRQLAKVLVSLRPIQSWCGVSQSPYNAALGRITYYDASPDDRSSASGSLVAYWNAIEVLDDTELGFGSLRGVGTKSRPPRQKGVDTLLAVDMLVGAFTNLFEIALLVAGDADFVPVVNEVRRRGVMVALAGRDGSVSPDLRRAVDRFIPLTPTDQSMFEGLLPPGAA